MAMLEELPTEFPGEAVLQPLGSTWILFVNFPQFFISKRTLWMLIET